MTGWPMILEPHVRPSLAKIFNRRGTDKLWAHHYEGEYERHFSPLRDESFNLLEIGIGGYAVEGRGGESLLAWEDYFPNSRIYGIDIEDKSFLDRGRIRTFKGSQSDHDFLCKVNDIAGPFRVIVDDGSHVQSDIMTSFNTLFPLLMRGGIYVIEDLATAYDPGHEGHSRPLSQNSPDGTIRMACNLIDGLHWAFWKNRGPTDIQRMVKSVHVSKELVFIYKKD